VRRSCVLLAEPAEPGSWFQVNRLTQCRKAQGTIACRKSESCQKPFMDNVLRDLFPMVKAKLPESKSPVKELGFCGNNGWNPHHSRNCPLLTKAAQLLEEWTMCKEHIQGDELDTYRKLERTQLCTTGLPKGREPYGNGASIVVCGRVMPTTWRREAGL
jgi:hypothetical protein